MCGIWGVFNIAHTGWLGAKQMDIARSMMIATSNRGDHSTGICVIPQHYEKTPDVIPTTIGKVVGGPHNILHNPQGNEFLKFALSKGGSLFGHGRYATRGKVSKENAHPFEEGDWVLVHNGTIHGGLKHGGAGEPEVDSHALCMKINEVGLKEALMSIDGAFAIIAYNKATKKIYAARNDQRPLHFFWRENWLYVMSTMAGLQFALDENNEYLTGRMKEIEEFKPNELWEVSPEGFVPAGSVKKPPPSMVTHTAWSGSNYPQPYQKYVGDPPIPNISEPKEGDVVDFTVDTYEQEGKSSYLYTAKGSLTAGGSLVTVCFRTNRALPKLIDRYGYATVHFRETVNLRERFFVKFKDIVWDEEEKVGEVVACNTCAEPVDKPGGGVVLHTGKMVCWACVNAFKKTHGSFSNLETMQ